MFRHGALVTASTGVPAAKASARVFQQCCSSECPQTVVRCGRLLMLCSQAAYGTSASKEVMSDGDLLLAGSSTAQSLARSSCPVYADVFAGCKLWTSDGRGNCLHSVGDAEATTLTPSVTTARRRSAPSEGSTLPNIGPALLHAANANAATSSGR